MSSQLQRPSLENEQIIAVEMTMTGLDRFIRSESFFSLKLADFEHLEGISGLTLRNKHTGKIVIALQRNARHNEVSILMEMMCRYLDQYHIIKCYGWFTITTKTGLLAKRGRNLVFEKLDISLHEYLSSINNKPMVLSDIRFIIKQMAAALEALKRIGLIHANISLENIVMENHQTRPFRVKLTDFRKAMLRSTVQQGQHRQNSLYRSPERILGRPFTEATDIWSLGRVMQHMICGHESDVPSSQDMIRLESNNKAEAEDREQCIELLKAMLEIDPDKRITPSEILTHPFIDCKFHQSTGEYLKGSFTETSLHVLDFEMMNELGEGTYGAVRKCRNNYTGETVAVKRPKDKDDCDKEIAIIQDLTDLNVGQPNIVRLCGCLDYSVGKAPVFEMLDINLFDFIHQSDLEPMRLSDIRVIIQQMATVLEALRIKGIIHADIKLDNMMLVDHQKRPFEVKLIDFGMALYKSEVEEGLWLQALPFRAPELFLGLPFSEAIDMWSLGCIMGSLICSWPLFSGKCREEMVALHVQLLGQPADHLLNGGKMSTDYFTKTKSNHWIHKRPEENLEEGLPRLPDGRRLHSIDDLKTMRLESDNKAEAEEREECIELLKAMLEIDPAKRITPSEVLTRPFIDYMKNSAFTNIHCHS